MKEEKTKKKTNKTVHMLYVPMTDKDLRSWEKVRKELETTDDQKVMRAVVRGYNYYKFLME